MSDGTTAVAEPIKTSDFSYLIEKIADAPFDEMPFRHLHIEDFFEPEHFEEIIGNPFIRLPEAADDAELFARLEEASYRVIKFPGCTTDPAEYMRWHRDKSKSSKTNTACEGFGIVLRLDESRSPILAALQQFLASEPFLRCLAEKFGLERDDCTYDGGIQKYLDGYEISPHADVKIKALTFMVNINPSELSEQDDHHTRYLSLTKEKQYVGEFWKGNDDYDRCWVPWDWCEVRKQQARNNSIVVFSPNHDTLHAVKADYDHRARQRTQLYGNLWYKDRPEVTQTRWEDHVVHSTYTGEGSVAALKALAPTSAKKFFKKVTGR